MKLKIYQFIIFLLMMGCTKPDPIIPKYPEYYSMLVNGKLLRYTQDLRTFEFPAYDTIPRILRLEGTANNRNDIIEIWVYGFTETKQYYGIHDVVVKVYRENILFTAGGSGENIGSGSIYFTEIDEKYIEGNFEITTSIYTYESDPGVIINKHLVITDGKFDLERKY